MKTLDESLGLAQPATPTAEPAVKTERLTAKEFSKRVLNSDEYLSSLKRRILADTLPPAVEVRLYEYAYGKPVERVDIRDKTNPLEGLSLDELSARARALGAMLARLKGVDTPSESEGTSGQSKAQSVH